MLCNQETYLKQNTGICLTRLLTQLTLTGFTVHELNGQKLKIIELTIFNVI